MQSHLIFEIHKLGLYGRGVDALIVEELFHFFRNLHVVMQVVTSDVG